MIKKTNLESTFTAETFVILYFSGISTAAVDSTAPLKK